DIEVQVEGCFVRSSNVVHETLNRAMRTGELARRAACSSQHVRNLEREGVLPPSTRASNGYRTFTEQHLQVLLAYQRLSTAIGPVQAKQVIGSLVTDPAAVAPRMDELHAQLHAERTALHQAVVAARTISGENVEPGSAQDAMSISELAARARSASFHVAALGGGRPARAGSRPRHPGSLLLPRRRPRRPHHRPAPPRRLPHPRPARRARRPAAHRHRRSPAGPAGPACGGAGRALSCAAGRRRPPPRVQLRPIEASRGRSLLLSPQQTYSPGAAPAAPARRSASSRARPARSGGSSTSKSCPSSATCSRTKSRSSAPARTSQLAWSRSSTTAARAGTCSR